MRSWIFVRVCENARLADDVHDKHLNSQAFRLDVQLMLDVKAMGERW